GATRRPLVKDITFDLAPREIVGIIGASGSGKSVLSRALVNWIDPPLEITSGTVSFRQRNILEASAAEMRVLRREIAYVGANKMGALVPTLPVGNQILEKLLSVVPENSRAEGRQRIVGLLDAVRIPSAASRYHEYPSHYSGGM